MSRVLACIIAACAAFACVAPPAAAVPVFQRLDFRVDASTLARVDVGDIVVVTLAWEDSLAGPGLFDLTFNEGLFFATIRIGGRTIREDDDVDFTEFPLLTLRDGVVDSFALVTTDFAYTIETSDVGARAFLVSSPVFGGEPVVVGREVPVPAPGMLMLTGLAALGVAARRTS